MYHFEATTLETIGWAIGILNIFVLPYCLWIFFCITSPEMEYKWRYAFYFGWIPGNVVSCWYLHYTIGWLDAIMLFGFTQLIQIVFVITAGTLINSWFGKRN
jgi:hypothetical protein